jgi:hypothetical protein
MLDGDFYDPVSVQYLRPHQHVIKNKLRSSTLRLLTNLPLISALTPTFLLRRLHISKCICFLTRSLQLLLQTPTLGHTVNGAPIFFGSILPPSKPPDAYHDTEDDYSESFPSHFRTRLASGCCWAGGDLFLHQTLHDLGGGETSTPKILLGLFLGLRWGVCDRF